MLHQVENKTGHRKLSLATFPSSTIKLSWFIKSRKKYPQHIVLKLITEQMFQRQPHS